MEVITIEDEVEQQGSPQLETRRDMDALQPQVEATQPLTSYQRYYQEHRAKILENQRIKREAVKDSEEYKRARRVYNKRHREAHDCAAYQMEYYHANKEKMREQRRRRYEAKKAAITPEERERAAQERREQRELRDQRLRQAGIQVPRRQVGRPKTVSVVTIDVSEISPETTVEDLIRRHFPNGGRGELMTAMLG